MMHIYNDIIEHRQYSVYTSKNSLTTYGIVDLMEKLSQKLPWLYLCINEIDVTDIGEQSVSYTHLTLPTNSLV